VKNSSIAVFDVSMHSNITSLEHLLAAGNDILYIDHHFPGEIPKASNLRYHINPDPDQCTSLIVDSLLGGEFRLWALCGAFGDNLDKIANVIAAEIGLSVAETICLREIGELINYNSYGTQVKDLYFSPENLYRAIREYRSPFDFFERSKTLKTLKVGFDSDMNLALSQPEYKKCGKNRIFRFPDNPWARRVSGVFANLKARENPSGAHALITENRDDSLRVSVRAPLENKQGADTLCRAFPSGGGRAAAAGINALPPDLLEDFLTKFEQTYS
jgi:single-stranded DNA-specific DHH superfamily exonuclease